MRSSHMVMTMMPMTPLTKEPKRTRSSISLNGHQSVPLKDIVLTTNRDDADSLGIRKWTELKGYVKMAFITANNIPIAQSHRHVGDLGSNIANEVNCSGYKH